MKGPSLDAIRRFKEQQERKKQEENERKIKEKLLTLEHRASQGDRKAKQELKRIERVEEEVKRKTQEREQQKQKQPQKQCPPVASQQIRNKPKQVADFEELMKIAQANNNEIRKKPVVDKPPEQVKIKKVTRPTPPLADKPQITPAGPSKVPPPKELIRPTTRVTLRPTIGSTTRPEVRPTVRPEMRPDTRPIIRPPVRLPIKPPRDYDYEVEDDYESDGFVVDDDEEDAQEELNRTLKSVFRYDRRRCDLREEELDRQYRAIGKVSTFEDLEREERRAARLAAAEDAKAFREEEERKRLKKIRLGK